MFRKIRSNRDPGRTVLVELCDEFRPYVVLARGKLVKFLKAHPRVVFSFMVLSILLSCVFSWGLFAPRTEREKIKAAEHRPNKSIEIGGRLENGLSKISATGARLRRTMQIRQQVDSVLDKGRLSNIDSLFLEARLDELRKLQ